MASTTFVDGTTPIVATWLNDVNDHVYDKSSVAHNASHITYTPAGTGATQSTAQTKLRESVSVKDFGAVGDGVTDDTTAFNTALASGYALYIPEGTFKLSALTGLLAANRTIRGAGIKKTVLRFTQSGIAFDLDSGASFTQGIQLSDFTIEGNSATTAILHMKAIARSELRDINLREAESTAGRALWLEDAHLNRFFGVLCSQDFNTMSSAPLDGITIEAANGRQSSNNSFYSCYFEGAGSATNSLNVGIRITGGDNNNFVGGSAESCKVYGVLISAGCRYNLFAGTGFENTTATTADVLDNGISTKYMNCYSSKKMSLNGRQLEINGGYFDLIEVQVSGNRCAVRGVTVRHWGAATGFTDAGTATNWLDIYDDVGGSFIYPRVGITNGNITPTGSPYTYTNSSGAYVQVSIFGGTVGDVYLYRNVGWVQLSTGVSNLSYMLAPNDALKVYYTVVPTMSVITHNGFQG